MLQKNEILDRVAIPRVSVTDSGTGGALNIEEVMRRARQIHRQHGGIFGYDFDDWALAWSAGSEANEHASLESSGEWNRALKAIDEEQLSESCLGFAQ